MARQAVRKKASPKAVTQLLTTPGSGGRRAFVSRTTKETRIAAAINLDGTGKYDIKTGIVIAFAGVVLVVNNSLTTLTLSFGSLDGTLLWV
ncbi:MAG TPA: hypothetical protein VK552_22240, partial [Reyranella sp.]|nr:hypothetical protein [Reyranella sp.]